MTSYQLHIICANVWMVGAFASTGANAVVAWVIGVLFLVTTLFPGSSEPQSLHPSEEK